MALIFCDGFDSYGSAADFGDKWSLVSNSQFNATAGRFGGGAAQLLYSGALAKYLPAPYAAGSTFGAGFWFQGPNNGATPIFITRSGGGATSTLLSITASGQVALNAVGGSTLITGSVNVFDGQWHWIEFWMTAQTATTGSAQLWVDGISQGSVSAVATAVSGALPIAGVGPWGNSNYTVGWFDDVIVWDNTGTAFNTAPIGPQRITTLNPSADGDFLQFTPSTGTTHFSCVNGAYSGTTYVSDTGTGNTDLYKYPSLAYSPTSVKAVVANYFCQDPGTVSANLIAKIKTSGTVAAGATFVLPLGTNKLYQNPFYTDASGAAWTASSVNAMQLGMGD